KSKVINVLMTDVMRALTIAMNIENARKRPTNHLFANANDPIVGQRHRFLLAMKHANLNFNAKTARNFSAARAI
ncbi:zinc finger protein, partial [Loa loa]